MKKISKFICCFLAVIMVLSFPSCVLKISATELSLGYKREATDEGAITDEFKAALADFSMSLFKGIVTKNDNNDLVSPLSAVLCLAMLANGADGETRAQMENVFGMDIDTLNKSLYAYTTSLYTSDDCSINIADSIWFRDNENILQINKDFLQANADWYDAQIYAAEFDDSTLNDINNWCKEHTDGMIKKIINKINPSTVMFLINALTFDAKWAVKYEKDDVEDGIFTNYDGNKSSVTMLSSTENCYLAADGVKGFTKNYAGDRYSIAALLPDENTDIYDYVNSLNGASWLSLWSSKASVPVAVKMPEFTYDSYMTLNDTLQTLGMTDMFSESKADFSKLSSSNIGNIFCSSVEQKVFIQVDRNGTKAAAITWVTTDTTSEEIMNSVILDRPFVYAIVDNATGLPIFLGVVTTL